MMLVKQYGLRKISIATCVLMQLMPFLLTAQQTNFTSYTQSIPGAEPKIDMVAIQAGAFMMGSPATEKGRQTDEGPVHRVKVDAFYMSKCEITWDVYELFVYKDYDPTKVTDTAMKGVDAVTRPTKPYLDMTFGMGKEGYPAVGMTQFNAVQFCKWLYTRTGIFYRLPTEAEWEYACRAGSATAYSFGNSTLQLGNYAWYQSNSQGKTHPVGTKKPNAWGLYDMYGNAAEWTIDQYIPDYYKKFKDSVAVNPVALPVKLYPHSIRGGSYADAAAALRSAERKKSDPAWKRMDPQVPKSNWWFPEAPFVGIRIVRPLTSPSKEEIDKYYNIQPIPDY